MNSRVPRLSGGTIMRAGLPTIVTPAGTSFVTTALAPTRAPSPMVMGPRI
jgi:hypothetical protein